MSGEEYDFTNILEKPIVIVTFVFLVVFYMIYIYVTNTSSSTSSNKDYYNVFESDNDVYSFSDNDSISSGIFAKTIIFLFILVIIVKGYQIIFNKTITASIQDFFTNNPKIDIHLNTQPTPTPTPITNTPILDKFGLQPVSIKESGINQVFNVPGNIYTYDNARALCKAYDGRLATYDEIENAYKKGGEWCNYGWSEGQNVYFPTQEKTYNTLQDIEGHENDCGRPGINGGYISNPQVRFGANCYGKKPIITQDEREIMETTPLYPLNKKDVWFNKQVDYFKTQLDRILLSPFNKQSWSASFI
jgi:hypothetical protein